MSKGKAEREMERWEQVFKALAHASRRHILVVLNSYGGKMTAGEIARRFSCRWPTTTRHLRLLESAGLVRVLKQGRERLYCLAVDQLRGPVENWLKWFHK